MRSFSTRSAAGFHSTVGPSSLRYSNSATVTTPLSKPTERQPSFFEHIDGRLGDARGRLADVGFEFGALVGDLTDVAGVADEDDAVAAEDDGAAVAGEAGEVRHVDGVADEEGVHALFGQLARQAFAARGGVIHAAPKQVRRMKYRVRKQGSG